MAGIELIDISINYGANRVLSHLNFSLEKGDRTVIAGPSGCGKTTLLRLIAGLEMPESGQIFFDGNLASKPGWILPPNKRKLGFVFQTASLWPHMTVEQNILFGLNSLSGSKAQERLRDILEKTSIQHLIGKYPDQISGGEARRVSIARALAPSPQYLLMDEPLTNLDQSLKSELLSMIRQLIAEEETTLLYVTHDFDEAAVITDRILILREGKSLEPKEES